MSETITPATPVMASPSPYLAIKHAQALFAASPDALTPEQQKKVSAVVSRQREIEKRILGSRQAAHVVVDAAAVERCVTEIAGRFSSESEFICDLARNGLSLQTLRDDIQRDMRVEAVLEAVSAKVPPVTNLEVEIFYHLHFERFKIAERRTLRHILVTVNDTLPSNRREEAYQRIVKIRELLLKAPDRFAEQALRHSECPTAMQGGLLGQATRGTLFPNLDEAAFVMRAGQISEILESPLGFHLVRCDNIQPAHVVALATVKTKIREQMLKTRRENKQKAWVRSVMALPL
jgi:peptidyl-prolyl cis-trans isomerase C